MSPDTLEFFKWLATAIGAPGVAVLATLWIQNQRGIKKRKAAETEAEEIPRGDVRYLAEKFLQLDRHVKDHTEIIGDVANSTARLADVLDNHATREEASLAEMRRQLENIHTSLVRLEAWKERRGE